ncbi:outer membrane lipoprotein-sorting protein [bacterium]|nr:outer membrane lipoprotein-sorting protein [bacterium]
MIKVISYCLLSLMVFIPQGWAEDMVPTASKIIEEVDNVINAPKDQDLMIKLILIDKNGKENVREMNMLQKGSDKRMVKFLSPASYKGIAFLSLPDDVSYLYLPAFKKVRRIASHVKNTKFAGTDFTYEDMESKRFSEKYMPELLRMEKKEIEVEMQDGDNESNKKREIEFYIIKLIPQEGVRSDYSKLIMWVRADNFYPTRIEHYDKGEKLFKIVNRDKIEKCGEYWISRESEMEDLKAKHKTVMIIEDMKFDSNLPDSKFTERYLSR